jgi:hypothetical protein
MVGVRIKNPAHAGGLKDLESESHLAQLVCGRKGACAMHHIQLYGKELAYDNNAYTITSTYHDGTHKLYPTHPRQSTSAERCTDYHMSKLRGWELTTVTV